MPRFGLGSWKELGSDGPQGVRHRREHTGMAVGVSSDPTITGQERAILQLVSKS